jgi:hypothetical protein
MATVFKSFILMTLHVTLLFANNQAVIENTEDNLQAAVYKLSKVTTEYNSNTALQNKGNDTLSTKIKSKITEQVMQFKYLGFNLAMITKKTR